MSQECCGLEFVSHVHLLIISLEGDLSQYYFAFHRSTLVLLEP